MFRNARAKENIGLKHKFTISSCCCNKRKQYSEDKCKKRQSKNMLNEVYGNASQAKDIAIAVGPSQFPFIVSFFR